MPGAEGKGMYFFNLCVFFFLRFVDPGILIYLKYSLISFRNRIIIIESEYLTQDYK